MKYSMKNLCSGETRQRIARSLNGFFILIVIVSIVSGCGMPTLPWQAGPTPKINTQQPSSTATLKPTEAPVETLPPTVLEATPFPSGEMPLNGSVTISFNQPMDKASVEGALQFAPGMGGSISWKDDSTLTFVPDQSLAPATQVSVTVGTTARASNGLALQEPVQLSYRTVDYLRLTQGLPASGAVDVDPTSALVASFNRPVVALGADSQGDPAPFTIEPQAEGKGEWINTSTYVFYPEPALEGGKTYSVQVNGDLTSSDAAPFEDGVRENSANLSWSFTTALPRFVSIEPEPGRELALDAAFHVKFNQPMDLASVERNFKLTDAAGTAIPGAYTWDEDHREVTFQPASRLPRHAELHMTISGEAQAIGGTPLGQDTEFIYSTYPEMGVAYTEPGSGGVLPLNGGFASISLIFSAPVEATADAKDFSITPEVPGLTVYHPSDTPEFVYLNGYFTPNQAYTLTVSANLADAWGRSMGQPYTFSFQTGPIAPSFWTNAGMLMSGGVYLTPQDQYLSASATNIASVNVVRGTVALPDFFKMQGPGGFNFMKTYRPGNILNWTQPLEVAADQAETVQIGVGPEKGTLPPGLYYFSIQSPEMLAMGGQPSSPIIVVVSPVHLTFKVSATEVLVWATRVEDQTAVSNANLTIYDSQGNVLGQGVTDEQGLFRTSYEQQKDPYQSLFAVLGEPGQGDFSLAGSNWNQGVNGWDFGVPIDFSGPRVKTYLYTDRPIYKPGQTVNFKAVVRQANYGIYDLPDLFHLPVEIYSAPDSSGETPLVGTLDLALNAFGTGQGSFMLPEDAVPGYYRLHPTVTEFDDLFFEVANYRKPEIDLQATLSRDEIAAGQNLQAHIQAKYYVGAPAGNLPVHWGLYRKSEQFALDDAVVGATSVNLDPFYFPGGSPVGTLVSEGNEQTGPDGSLDLDLPADMGKWAEEGLPQLFTLEVTITDTNNQPVSERVTATVHPADFYAGVIPDASIGQADEEMGFSIQTVNWNNQPASVEGLTARFQKVAWEEKHTDPVYELVQLVPQYTEIGSTDFSTDTDGKARLSFTAPEPGTYAVDIRGHGAHSQALIWVGGPGETRWPAIPNQRLEMTADAGEYRPGQTAEVFIPNPLGKTVQALVTVERGQILRAEVVRIQGSGTTYAIPLTDADAPNVYLSVTLLGRNADGRPDFREGLVNLVVKPVAQTLNVELISTPERSEPGGEVTLGLRVTDYQGQPVRGEFSIAVVDLAALALAEPNAPGIVEAFYRQQPLGVKTSLSLAAYALRSGNFANGQGGGGSGQVFFDIRDDFRDTAYWNAEVVTDANGEARVSVKLPENLTTWRVDVRGITADTRAGEAEKDIVTSKDLLVRPVTPRFFVAGDHVRLAAIVHNNTSTSLETQVTLQADGFVLDEEGEKTQSVTVPAGGQQTVTWMGTVQTVPEVGLVFSAQAGNLSDAATPEAGKLPVYRYSSPQTFATAGVLAEGGERLEVVSVPQSYTPTGGELQVDLAPSLASAMIEGLTALNAYPYQSNEAMLSRLLPNLETQRLLDQFDVPAPDLRAQLGKNIPDAIERLLTRQNKDGGWGWVIGGKSDRMITAYILIGLSQARKSGIEVDLNPILRAQEFLRSTLTTPDMVSERWQLDRLAFLHFALQESALGDPNGASALFEVRDQLNPWAKALLAITLEGLSPGDERAKSLISDLEASAIRSATGAHWEETEVGRQNMSSPVTTTAVVIYAIAQRDPASPVIPEAIRYMMANRKSTRQWGSTYETAWVLMAMGEALKGTGELQGEYAFTASLNGTVIGSGKAAGLASSAVETTLPMDSLHLNAPNALRIRRDGGAGQLYYSAALSVYRPVESAPAIEAGMSLERTYTVSGSDCKAGDCPAIDQVSLSGGNDDRVTVRLALTVPNDMYHVAVEDYIPAGAEILNTNLQTSQLGNPEEQPVETYDPADPFGQGWGWWYFDQPAIYDNRISWWVDFLPAGTYVLTYTLVPLQVGEYRLLPARAWETYFPEVQAATSGAIFEITD